MVPEVKFLFSSDTINVFEDENGNIYMEENNSFEIGFLTVSVAEMEKIIARFKRLTNPKNVV